MTLRRLEYITGLGLSILALCLYVATLCPTVSFIDSGELATVACTLGIAHPTGYPLFSLLSWVFVHLPLGLRPIYQLNLMAAVFCAAGVFFFFRLFVFFVTEFFAPARRNPVRGEAERPAAPASSIVPAAFGALVLAFSETYWSQALAIEVYSLHVLLLSILLFLFTKAAWATASRAAGEERLWLATAFLLGLSFTNHMTTILVIPGFAFMYFAVHGLGARAWKRLLRLAVPFLLGFSVYCYLPIRAGSGALMNWGNPVTFERLFWHFSGKVYRVWIFSSTESAVKQFNYFMGHILDEFATLPLLVAALGIFHLLRERKRAFIFVLVLFFGCLLYSINYDIHDIDSYFLLAYIAIVLFSSAGAWKLMSIARTARRRAAAAFLLAAVCALLAFHSYGKVNEREDRIVEDYTRDMLNSIGPNGILISYQWDYFVSAAYYMQIVEKERTDVVVIDKELMRRSWYYVQLSRRFPWLIAKSKKEVEAFTAELDKFEHDRPYTPGVIEYRYAALIRSFIEKNLPTRPVYVTGEIENQYTAAYQRVPSGLAFRLYADTLRHPVPEFSFSLTTTGGKDDQYTRGITEMYVKAYVNNALSLERLGKHQEARDLTEKALSLDPGSREALFLRERLSRER